MSFLEWIGYLNIKLLWIEEVIFKISNDEEFKFIGDKSFVPQNLIFTIMARKMLRKGISGILSFSQGYYSGEDIHLRYSNSM